MALESLPPHVRSRYQVEYEDDGLQPSKSVSAFQKLIHSGKIDLLLNFSSNTSKALAPLAERNKVPFLAVASYMTISRGKKFTYNFFASSDELGQLASSAARKRGIKSFARATTIQDGVIAYKHAFDRAAKGNPVATIDEEFSPEITDFRAFLTKVRSRPETEALFVLLLPGRAGIFAKQARELGLQQPFFSIEVFSNKEEVPASVGAIVGSWYASLSEPPEFIDRYRARFKDAPTFGAAYGHDAFLLAQEGLNRGLELPDFFSEVRDFKGAMGNISSYSTDTTRSFTLPVVIKEVTTNGFRILEN